VSHHEGVKSVLQQAGLDAQRWSAYSLRHSFALHAPPAGFPRTRAMAGGDRAGRADRYQRIRQEMVEEAAWLHETS
jgi:hypothetical protein